ncbi:conserved unknown protein [Ectocarpus siliculosus]|uniref:Sugar phosphate transporter domain-containing protein n=1 Tax=Ectocarpus siliculosus TaxID=2880 RepID=D7FYJ9_ECTSI|nr:conserved unknown protein [Ectocarpus siliculosus]|eukprot:CBJ32541.1 conserved unknown protein [Ectocarpus siliculosus]
MVSTTNGGVGGGGGMGGGDAAKPVTVQTQALWLLAWLVNNIGITMLNKQVMSFASFDYPLVMSAFHMFCNWLGTVVYFARSGEEQQTIKRQQWPTLIMFSVVFALNISVGNTSSSMVPVTFNQVMRSLVPVIVMVIGTQVFGKTFSRARKLAVLPIVAGVIMACYPDSASDSNPEARPFRAVGVIVTVFCVMLSGLKNVVSGEMLTGDIKMPPLQLLSRMAPLALVQMAVGALALGEVSSLVANWREIREGWALYGVAITGVGSFSLNLCSLQANKVTSPLTLSIMANIKQVLIVAASSVVFKDTASTLNKFGFVVVILASTRYSMLSVSERNKSREVKALIEPPEIGIGKSLPLLPK